MHPIPSKGLENEGISKSEVGNEIIQDRKFTVQIGGQEKSDKSRQKGDSTISLLNRIQRSKSTTEEDTYSESTEVLEK